MTNYKFNIVAETTKGEIIVLNVIDDLIKLQEDNKLVIFKEKGKTIVYTLTQESADYIRTLKNT